MARPPRRFCRAQRERPIVLGHRGARHAAPENTLRAFELAREEGAQGVELDVRLTADERVIVLHDPSLARVSSGQSHESAEALPYSEIARVDVGAGERVPLLSDVLDWARRFDLLVNIEVKADLRRRGPLIRALAALLAPRADERERLLLSSFHPQFVWSLARLLPEFGVAWLVHEGQPLLRRAPGFRALGAVGVNPQHTLLSSASVREARRTGALIATWTVNDPELARAYAKFGVDAIISDCPGAILEALARAPELP